MRIHKRESQRIRTLYAAVIAFASTCACKLLTRSRRWFWAPGSYEALTGTSELQSRSRAIVSTTWCIDKSISRNLVFPDTEFQWLRWSDSPESLFRITTKISRAAGFPYGELEKSLSSDGGFTHTMAHTLVDRLCTFHNGDCYCTCCVRKAYALPL